METPSNYVQAIFSFKGSNNDELCFKKGQIISITQREDGGWWEGTLDGKTGWFPSNYVTEYKTSPTTLLSGSMEGPLSGPTSPSSIALPIDLAAQQKLYKGVVIKDLLESERSHVNELRTLVVNYLRPLKTAEVLNPDEYSKLIGNIEEVLIKYSRLLAAMEEGGETGEGVKIGKLFLTSAPGLSECLQIYCANHPFAVALLEIRREALNNFMESRGAQAPGLLVLTAGLSKPFRRVDKYQGLLQEVLRHITETDPDRGDTQRAVHVYKELAVSCSSIRRQKQLQLEVLSGTVRNWEGEDVAALGDIVHMGSVAVGPTHSDRYLVLFPKTLLVLAVSSRMSGFIYQGKLQLSAIQIKKLEDSEIYKNAFEITSPMIEPIIAVCQTREDQQRWIELIQNQSTMLPQNSTTTPSQIIKEKPNPPQHQVATSPHHRVTSPISHSNISMAAAILPPPVRAVSVGSTPQGKTHPSPPPHKKGASDSMLLKGWSLSCLRPKPPLRAGLGLGAQAGDQQRTLRKKEERSYEEDAQILSVIEAYCLSSKTRHTLNSSLIDSPQVLIAEEEKIIVEDHSGGHTVIEEKSLVDTVYALKDQVKGLAAQMAAVVRRLDTEEGHRATLQLTLNTMFAASNNTKTAAADTLTADSTKKESSIPNNIASD
ncbi:rho guanine nucleotide exchange factor 7 [Neocloeon triangulifer]|uniref:rho guanine nucleotide exchange factor 7 n=1 Tax=Neocloeon triangulifer TaxID=2078957 RepID=UPI00286F8245|nr:rho guanine nucleotide exchange factor 7 [Neocloeon triangulifer]XP_059482594.1 rho guanine nucleotide exchange factor 7 [Neocloeon triangulifer]XP_059482596.1 rho guanine nucleotide exchange factor 7 [Neocloeon triangulifer]